MSGVSSHQEIQMFKIWFQLHGSIDVNESFFANRLSVDIWLEKHADELSFSKVVEVFH